LSAVAIQAVAAKVPFQIGFRFFSKFAAARVESKNILKTATGAVAQLTNLIL
jgi:hypothetical protein